MKTALPKSKAKTAYGLLSEVRRLILAEPKRYDQGQYICRKGGRHDARPLNREFMAPACGTVGCVAGWVATLKRGDNFGYMDTFAIASETLGIDADQGSVLFDGGAIRVAADTGSPAYARAGDRHIARFQKKFAKQLKAKAV